MRTNAIDSVIADFHTLQGAERALKEFNGMHHDGATFLAKRLYDFDEEKAKPVYVMDRPDLNGGRHAG